MILGLNIGCESGQFQNDSTIQEEDVPLQNEQDDFLPENYPGFDNLLTTQHTEDEILDEELSY